MASPDRRSCSYPGFPVVLALLRLVDLGFDARTPLTGAQIGEPTRWRVRSGEKIGAATARAEVVRLARRITDLDDQIKDNTARMKELLQASPAAPLLAKTGIGPVTAAICYTLVPPRTVRTEAAFAALAGVNHIPASSGNTVRHRRNRGGDRRPTVPCTSPSSPA